MAFYFAFFIVAVILCFLIISFFMLDIFRKKAETSWIELVVLWDRRTELIYVIYEYSRDFFRDKEMTQLMLKVKIAYVNAKTPVQIAHANEMATNAYEKLTDLIKCHIDYEYDDKIIQLMDKIVAIQQKINFKKKFYIDSVAIYNQLVTKPPISAVAYFMTYKKITEIK